MNFNGFYRGKSFRESAAAHKTIQAAWNGYQNKKEL